MYHVYEGVCSGAVRLLVTHSRIHDLKKGSTAYKLTELVSDPRLVCGVALNNNR